MSDCADSVIIYIVIDYYYCKENARLLGEMPYANPSKEQAILFFKSEKKKRNFVLQNLCSCYLGAFVGLFVVYLGFSVVCLCIYVQGSSSFVSLPS